ncbi:VOC family protein [Hydrogenophaga sp. SL48]|jgi:predicted enzyme related to lactoylglutathione lyase|uniref:VOC family protein n=1 Tax=Hydrogenophaga sp. SL48 TaxID=2806347 RepID=UPI001F412FAD|nr:VOC family protein [Hydrogenophaga sp. SL48]UJW80084.1 VOC family protein [Hydrogenophaga sp. SL48]
MAHALNWFEIPVADMDRALGFYAALTGRSLRREAFGGPGEELGVFEVDGEDDVKGALLKNPRFQPSADGTLVYLNAGSSLDAWLARVPAAGGRVALPKVTLPEGMGCFAHIIDSEGNRVGLHALA